MENVVIWTGEACDYDPVPLRKGCRVFCIKKPLVRRDQGCGYIRALVRFARIYQNLIKRGWEEVGFA